MKACQVTHNITVQSCKVWFIMSKVYMVHIYNKFKYVINVIIIIKINNNKKLSLRLITLTLLPEYSCTTHVPPRTRGRSEGALQGLGQCMVLKFPFLFLLMDCCLVFYLQTTIYFTHDPMNSQKDLHCCGSM